MPAHPAPPPLSAVAARRAAREAASAKQEQVHTSQSERGKLAGGAERQEDAMDDEGMASDASSESSTSEAEVARMLADEKRTQNSRTGKGKATTRYFAAESSRNEEEQDGDEVMAVDGGDLSPPEGLEDAGVAPTASASGYSTPNRNRRRRERTAFVDPYCVSSFALDEGVNAFQVQVAGEDGVERKAVVYALKADETLVIRGVCTLTPIHGSLSLLGSTLTAPPPSSYSTPFSLPSGPSYPLFAPSSHPIPSIRALPPPSPISTNASLLLPSGHEISLAPFVAAILITDLQTGVEGIERVFGAAGLGCGVGLFRRRDAERERERTEGVQDGKTWELVREPSPSLAGLREVEAWTSAFSSTLPPSPRTFSAPNGVSTSDRLVAVVEGPKRVGKSTFAKMLVNQLLERYEKVAYLDTDLGQPEFTPPGFVSLSVVNEPILAPAFTHLSQPLSSHYLGSTSPASDPSGYLAAISALLSTYALEVEYPSLDEASSSRRHRRGQPADESNRADSSRKYRERVPLVINTQGWVKGLGADLLAKLKAESQPSHIFSFVETVENGASASDYAAPAQPTYSIMPPSADAPYFLASLPPAPPSPLESKWSAVDLRTLSLISYFHSVQSARSPAWDFTTPLVGVAPYEFDWRAERRQVAQVHVMEGADVAYEHALHALNGSVVALVQEASPAASATSRPFPYDPSAPLPFPSTSRALGLAVVHSISPATSTLHLLTPVLASVLASSAPISLVKGSLDLPIALMLDFTANPAEAEQGIAGVEWAEVPYLSVDAAEGAGRRRVRRNLMRRGQA
ncbi:Polynucleotide 5'-hydroxyl-kinase grc3 [Rhodotorula toruloides]|uniref:Polynucleotide 5'-hydroxyl-kinase GRC3 n=2 Tax=Rhodotorula toruloides TaxID=5286 RepID=A0A0K3CIY0_RHOTO